MYPTEVTSEETKRSVVQDVHRPDGLLIYAGLRAAVGSEQLRSNQVGEAYVSSGLR